MYHGIWGQAHPCTTVYNFWPPIHVPVGKIHPWRYQNKAKITTHRGTSKKFRPMHFEFLCQSDLIGIGEENWSGKNITHVCCASMVLAMCYQKMSAPIMPTLKHQIESRLFYNVHTMRNINYIGLIEPPDAKYQGTSSPGLFTPLPIFNTQSMRFMNSTQFTLIDIAETLWMRAEELHNICSRDCNYLSSTFHFVKFAQSGQAQAKWNVNDRCTGY